MYKVYDEVNNEIVITKNKFSKFDIEKYAKKVNVDLARGLRSFIYNDIHKDEFIGQFVKQLKSTLARNLSDDMLSVIDSIRVYDSVTVDAAPEGLPFSNIRVLFTWDGDTRPVEMIKQAAHLSLKDRKDYAPWTFSGIDGFTEFTQDDYVGIATFPVITDNCTFRMYSDGYTDTPDSEYFIKLKVDNKPGLYFYKKKAILSGPSTRITFADSKIEDTMSNNYNTGKHPRFDIYSVLYFYALESGNIELWNKIKSDLASKPFLYKKGNEEDNEKLIEKLIENGFTTNTFLMDLDTFDGIERIATLEGYTLAEDYDGFKCGYKVTKDAEQQLKQNNKYIKLWCKVPEEYCLAEDIKVPVNTIVRYISRSNIKNSAKINNSTKYGNILHGYIIDCVIDGDTAVIPKGSLLTQAVQDILLTNGITEPLVYKLGSDSTFEFNIGLTRIVLLNEDTGSKIYNICSLLKAMNVRDTVAYYNTLNPYTNYNKIILTPEFLFKKYTLMIWKEHFKQFGNKLVRRIINKGNAIDLKLLLREYFIENRGDEGNPFNVMSKTFIRTLRHHLQTDSDYLEMVDTTAATNPINFLSSITRVDLSISNSRAISFDSRMITVPMLGRYDSFEVPPSHKIGATTHLTINSRVDREGNILARYYVVNNRQITNEVKELKILDDHKYNITSLSEVDVDDNGYITNKSKILAKTQSSTNYYGCDLTYIDPNEIDLISMSLLDELSWATSTLLFIGNNDSARITYGCSQIKQAKSIINAEIPMVITPTWRLIPKVQEMFTNARANTGDRKYPLPKLYNTQHSVVCQFHRGPYHYKLKEYNDVECSEIKLGTLALGINALVAFYPDGSTYEDAVHMSKNFANRLIAYRIDKKESKPTVVDSKESSYTLESDIKAPLVAVCPIVTQGDLLAESPRIRLKQKYVSNEPALYLNRSIKFGDSSGGKKAVTVTCETLTMSSLQAGDKVSNRHANKGVLSATSPEELPCLLRKIDGKLEKTTKQLDVVYNPFGVIARMNIGQLFEAQLGLISKVLNIKFNVEVINNDTVKDLMYKTWKLVNASDNEFTSVAEEFNLGSKFVETVTKLKGIIQSWKGLFDEKGRSYVEGSRTPVNIGYVYINRLTQESETKINARGGRLSNPNYSVINGEPSEGAKLGGGQRFGNMENDALLAYGAYGYLNSALNERGSNLLRSFKYTKSYIDSDMSRSEFDMQSLFASSSSDNSAKLPNIRLTSAQLISYLLALGVEVNSETNNNTDYVLDIKQAKYRMSEVYEYGNTDNVAKGFTNSTYSKEQLHEAKTHSTRVQELLAKLNTSDFDYNTKKNETAPNGLTWQTIIEQWAFVMDHLDDNEEEPSIYDIVNNPSVVKCDSITRLYRQKKRDIEFNKQQAKNNQESAIFDDGNDPILGLQEENDDSVYIFE